jgi:hypothetical protein
VPLSVDPDVREAALATLSPLRQAGAGHRQRVLELTSSREGVAVIAEPAPGRSASSLRRLSPGQLVTLGLPIARELAALHAGGLVFGADGPALGDEIVISPAGRPLLTVNGWARRRLDGGARDGARAAGDLAALITFLAGAAAPMSGRAATRWKRARGAADCAGLARSLRRLARPRPLPAPRPRAASIPAGARGRRAHLGRVPELGTALRRLVLPAALAAAVVVVALLGWSSARHSRNADAALQPAAAAGSTAPASSPAAAAVWQVVLASLDRARGEVFAGIRPVADVDADGGNAYAADSADLAQLRARGLRAEGLLPQLVAVEPAAGVTNEASEAVLSVTDTLPAYRLVDAARRTTSVAGRGSRTWQVTLTKTAAGWRIRDVVQR